MSLNQPGKAWQLFTKEKDFLRWCWRVLINRWFVNAAANAYNSVYLVCGLHQSCRWLKAIPDDVIAGCLWSNLRHYRLWDILVFLDTCKGENEPMPDVTKPWEGFGFHKHLHGQSDKRGQYFHHTFALCSLSARSYHGSQSFSAWLQQHLALVSISLMCFSPL